MRSELTYLVPVSKLYILINFCPNWMHSIRVTLQGPLILMIVRTKIRNLIDGYGYIFDMNTHLSTNLNSGPGPGS